jgi:hypothetical protein
MMRADDPPPSRPGIVQEVGKAVAIAALSAAATQLITWGVDTVKDRLRGEQPKPEADE